MKSVCLIPARMGSSRFPGKPLATLLGLETIIHIYKRCCLCQTFERVVVATCDQEIFDAVTAHGGEAVMTSPDHERCTDRIAEARVNLGLELEDEDFILMVQGDEIFVTPSMTGQMIRVYEEQKCPVINLVSPLTDQGDIEGPDTVKVVADRQGRALYFSRSPIPSDRRGRQGTVYQQTGIIGFSASFLDQYATLMPTPLEEAESVDMLRVVEHGYQVQLVYTDQETIGIDTEAELKRAEKSLAKDPLIKEYM